MHFGYVFLFFSYFYFSRWNDSPQLRCFVSFRRGSFRDSCIPGMMMTWEGHLFPSGCVSVFVQATVSRLSTSVHSAQFMFFQAWRGIRLALALWSDTHLFLHFGISLCLLFSMLFSFRPTSMGRYECAWRVPTEYWWSFWNVWFDILREWDTSSPAGCLNKPWAK